MASELVRVSRDGAIVTVVTIDASAQGIGQILWMMRPSKLAAISRSFEPESNRVSHKP